MPAEVPLLKPYDKWGVDHGDTRCVASRSFGDPKSPVMLGIRPSLNDTTVRIIILRDEGYLTPRHVPVTVAGMKASALRFSSKETKQRVMWIDLARADFDRAVAAPSLRVIGEGMDVDLALTGIASALKVMQTCNAGLRAHWNADEAGMARVATRAKSRISPAQAVTNEDYPGQAIEETKGGRTRVMLLIDEHGAAKECIVEEHSGVASIDAQTCFMVLKRGKFAPALDAAGKPIKSYLSYAFKWQIK
ncbi:energy transducer TonB [Sphingomonas koreensis]